LKMEFWWQRARESRYGGDDPQPGDVIHAVNRHPVKVVEELRSEMRDVKPDAPIVLQVERNGSMLFLVLESI
jgi:S1-C subfamily serine protease